MDTVISDILRVFISVKNVKMSQFPSRLWIIGGIVGHIHAMLQFPIRLKITDYSITQTVVVNFRNYVVNTYTILYPKLAASL